MKIVSKRKNISLFLLLLTVITTLNGVSMGFALYFRKTTSLLGELQMMIPAIVTFLVFWISPHKSSRFPKYVCKAVFAMDILLIAGTVLECLPFPIFLIKSVLSILFYLGMLIFYLALFLESTEVKNAYGLCCKSNVKTIFFYLFLFLLLQAGVCLIQTVFDYFTGNRQAFRIFMEIYSHLPSALPIMAINFFFAFLPFFGEEYGWRGFLQPQMQKQFGMKKGIILTGVIWGIWHLPMILFRYHSSTPIFDIVDQILFCVLIGIFLGYVYLKTQNIWICTAIHFLNNQVIYKLFSSTSATSSSNSMTEEVVSTIALFLVYGLFIHSKVFREKEIIDDFLLPRNIPEFSQNELEQENSK